MKTIFLIVIGIVSGILILVTLTAFIVPEMEANHHRECVYDGGKVTGFLQCTRVHLDYSLEPTTVRINLGALDPQSKNPIFPKEMTVILGENNTVALLNTDGPSHFINFEDWSIGPIHQGERQSVTFNQTGVYEYFSADSPSISGYVIVKSDLDTNELDNFASTLAEINQEAVIHQKNNNQEKSERQLILMKEKQKEIASKILEVNISDAYVTEGWNYPFRDKSEIKPMAGTEPIPTCNIPERIPIHLQKIRQSEMFQMFVGKYSQHQLMIDISDERYHVGSVHYDLIATSDDGSFTASTYFHLDSCTDNMKLSYFLLCKDVRSDEHISTRIKSEIMSSLKSTEFCDIELEPWHQAIRDYQLKISDESYKLHQKMASTTGEDESYGLVSELNRLGLLNNIARHYESGNTDASEIQEYLRKYEIRFGSLPDELLELIENRK